MFTTRNVLGIACAALLAGCAVGAPPGFSSGSKWSFPLIAPLEDGPLLAPVMINGKGPYLFVIDPDSDVSSIDSAIQSEQKLFTVNGGKRADERDVRVNTSLAEVQKITVGTLSVRNRKLRVVTANRYWINGRLIRGVIGRDIIADSLIFAYNRDTGMGYIATQGNLLPPSNAITVPFRRFNNKKMVYAMLNKKHKVELHVDLGGPVSTLWPSKMKKFRLPQLRANAQIMDDMGTIHMFGAGTLIGVTEVKGLDTRAGMFMLAYNDKRMQEVDIDGTLGQNFLKNYNITANWHKGKFYMSKRAADAGAGAKERMRRWGPAFDKCKNAACVEVKVVAANAKPPGATTPTTTPPGTTPPTAKDPADKDKPPASVTDKVGSVSGAPMPAPASFNLRVSREAMAIGDYEILIEALDKAGKPMGLPKLLVTLPKGVPMIQEAGIQRGYEKAASFRVLDLSPFPRKCQMTTAGQRKCVWPVRAVR